MLRLPFFAAAAVWVLWASGCAVHAQSADAPSTDAPTSGASATCTADAPACLGVGEPAAPGRDEALVSVLGSPLQACSRSPLTGFYRDGLCRTGPEDRGVHVVCAEVDAEFLALTKARGNDLSTPLPRAGFPGLSPGDRWCLCAARWEEARLAGHAPKVVLESTHAAALGSTTRDALVAHAVP